MFMADIQKIPPKKSINREELHGTLLLWDSPPNPPPYQVENDQIVMEPILYD